ncbi:MAG TPA: DUF4345 domain-containing protein [Acidobacteriota bacterium]|nr:DUF4345 domain-containing protein [Acidobacteriota bacterium]
MWVRIVLGAGALINILLGATALVAPRSVAELAHLQALNQAGVGEIRAFYGAFVLAIGAVILHALRRPQPGREWLRCLGILFLGLCCGRLVSALLDGLETYTLAVLTVELLFAGLLLYGAEALRPSDAPPTQP